jgi:hypothetical protein
MENNVKFEKWLKSKISRYSKILGISDQIITIESDSKHYMEISCSYPYHDPIIRYSEEALNNWKKGKLIDDRVLHELCHILTDPLYCKTNARYSSENEILDERERLTDKISIIIRNLL